MEEKKLFCTQCGAQADEDAVFCTECGALLNKEEPVAVEEDVPAPVEEVELAPQKKLVSKKNSVMSMIFATVALQFAFFSYSPISCFMFLPVAIIFIALGLKKRNAFVAEAGKDNVFSNIGKIVSIISIPLAAICGLIGFIATIFVMIGGVAVFDDVYAFFGEAFESVIYAIEDMFNI